LRARRLWRVESVVIQRVRIGHRAEGLVPTETLEIFGEHRGIALMAELASGAQVHHEHQNARPNQVFFGVKDTHGIARVLEFGERGLPVGKEMAEKFGQQDYGGFGLGPRFLTAARRFSGTWAWRIAMLSLEISTIHFSSILRL